MILRLEAWFVVICVGVTTASVSHPCPCIPRNLCPRVFGESPVDEKVTGPMEPCSDPGTVHCCGTSVSLHEQKPIPEEVAREMRKEEELMTIVNNTIERMIEQYSVEDTTREDKSIGFTNKNNLNCNTKQCSGNISEEKSTSASTATSQNESFSSTNIVTGPSKLSGLMGNDSVEKLYVVYAESPNTNNAYLGKESKAEIVLPMNEPKEENLSVRESTGEESENEPQESLIDPIIIEPSEKNRKESLTETTSSFPQRSNQSNRLKNLFPRRRPPPHDLLKNSQDKYENQQRGGDMDTAESNLDEVRETKTLEEGNPDDDVYDEIVSTEEFQSQGSQPPVPVPANSQNRSEQTYARRVPLPPRHLTSQLMGPDENKETTKNALDLLRSRTKSRTNPTTVQTPREESMKNTQHDPVGEHVAMLMDEINVKVINDIMKTNFTGRPSSRPNSSFKSSRAPMKTETKRLASSLNKNNQEQKITESIPQPQRPTTQNIQDLQAKVQTQISSITTLNQEQSTNHGTNLSEENKIHRFQLRARPPLRTHNKLSSKSVAPVSMTQEQAFDTSKEAPNSQVKARRQPYSRIRPRPQVTSQNTADKLSVPLLSQSSEEQSKPTPSEPIFSRKRLPIRERLRQRVENMNIYKNKQNEESRVTTSPEAQKTTSENPLGLGTTNEGGTDTTTNDGESRSIPSKTGHDLFESESNFDYQQYQSRGQGKFRAPLEVETGFHPMPPMVESRQLKVIGPLPGGFLDSASGLSDGDELGLELPHPNLQTQFKTDGRFNQNNRPLNTDLLPPVFPVLQPEITIRSQFSPVPPPTETQFLENEEEEEETPQLNKQEGDLTQIQNQFGSLKNQYDTLLKRYAETLNIYIGQYKMLFNSAPPNIS